MSFVFCMISGPGVGSSHESLSLDGDKVEGAPIRKPRHVVEYYESETGSRYMWTALKHPVREGYAFPDSIVYALEGKRDYLRRREMELDGEVNYLQAEVSRLLGMVETLQGENAELRADRVRTGERLRRVSMDARAMKLQLKTKDVGIARGMQKIKEAYDTFEKAALVSETVNSRTSEPNVAGRELVPIVEEEAGGSNAVNEMAMVPVENQRPYMGWCYG